MRVVFELERDDDWPPAASERLWAVPVGPGLARVDNIPFFVRGLACGDVVRFEEDEEGVRWGQEVVESSGNCTIRVLPKGDLGAALDLFAPLGVEGEGFGRFGLVALNVPPTADLAAVRRLLRRLEEAGWEYEEGSITPAWCALDPA